MTQEEFDEMMEIQWQREKEEKVKKYSILNTLALKGQTVMTGSSLMEFFPVNELQQTLEKQTVIYNRGIAGYVTRELLEVLEVCVLALAPSKLFINIGTNDISSADGEYKLEKLLANYNEILTRIRERLPECKVYVMAYYPVNAKAEFPGMDEEMRENYFRTRTNAALLEANSAVEQLAGKHGYEFINVNEGLTDAEGNLKEEYTMDGVHMYGNGYSVVLDNLKKYL
ncbi:GDSL-like Lipase/Acylhydrolase family protein [Paenibacillus sp. FSL R7-277]|uniref:GDSL-type esterase/lipase family protein n=1 Tax=unclassified Paenibacillus TaxID=185978 RepID=UPI0003E1DE55|nr:GDSL-type esterase/lipase family protein [Paenibacillus sp. FSL R7-277]ETT59131.1 GDSL-like Lipase/Acylhydrolase family protein [Paenibacillus sp. FSL R7-277]